MHYSVRKAAGAALAVLFFGFECRAEIAGNTTVYWTAGKKLVHIESCPRYRRLTPAEKAAFTEMTLAEAKAKNLRLCSRCPADAVPAKPGGNEKKSASGDLPESWVNPPPVAKAGEWKPEVSPFQESQYAPLVSLGTDGKLVYRPYTEQGDKIIDFSYCGYKKSEQPIPDVPIVETLTPPAGKAKPVGGMKYPVGTDSTAVIQSALDKVAAQKADENGIRGAVLLKKGIWYVKGNVDVHSGVVLRGEGDGEDGTVLIVTVPESAGLGGVGIHLRGHGSAQSSGPSVQIADRYVPSGSRQLKLKDADSFAAGDTVNVVKTTNAKWIELLGVGERLRHIRGGTDGASKRPWKPGQYSHLRRIEAIDGNTITLDVPLPQSIEEVYGGGYVQKLTPAPANSQCGVENLRIVSNYDPSVTGNKKDTNYFNLKNGVVVSCADGWVRKVTAVHVWYAAVAMNGAQYCTVRDCRSLQPIGPVRGGKRYTYSIGGSTGMLVYNCYAEEGRHDFVVGARTPGPNAFVKCTALAGGQSEPHHRWGTGTLYDNIELKDGGSLAAINRGDSGTGHGWAAANTVFWNCDANNIVVFDPESTGENNFAIGFTGSKKEIYTAGGLHYANTRAGYWGAPQEGKFFGYAAMGNGYIESPDKPVEPDSLFEQQLIDRIGKEKAMQVLQTGN